MSIQYTLAASLSSPTGVLVNSLTASGDTDVELNLTIAPAAVSAETDITIIEATLQSFYIVASAAMTVVCKAGTGGSGTTYATFTLTAGVPVFWFTGNGTNPFTGNVGQFLVTSTAGGTLNIRALSQN
jgi:hypothetical protein